MEGQDDAGDLARHAGDYDLDDGVDLPAEETDLNLALDSVDVCLPSSLIRFMEQNRIPPDAYNLKQLNRFIR